MDYFSPRVGFIASVEFRAASPASNGVWLRLHGFCSGQENSGRITGCKVWTDQKWQACIACKKVQVEHMVREGLGDYDGNDLVLRGYDLEGQTMFQQARERNRIRAKGKHAGGSEKPAQGDAGGSTGGSKKPVQSAAGGSKNHDNQAPPGEPAALHMDGCMDGNMDGGSARVRAETPPPSGLVVLEARGVTVNRDLPGFTKLVQGMTPADVEEILDEFDGTPYWPSDLSPAKAAWQRRKDAAKTQETARIQDQRRERQRVQEAETQRTMQQTNAEALARAKAVLAAIETDQSLLDGISPRAHELVSKIQVNTLAGKPAPIWLGQLLAEAPALANASRLQARAAS